MSEQLQEYIDVTRPVFDQQDYADRLYEEAIIAGDTQYLEDITHAHTNLVNKAYGVYQPGITQEVSIDNHSKLHLFATKPGSEHPSRVITIVRSELRGSSTWNTLLYTFGSIVELETDLASRGLATVHDYDKDKVILGATQSVQHCGKKRNIPLYNSAHLEQLSELLDQFKV